MTGEEQTVEIEDLARSGERPMDCLEEAMGANRRLRQTATPTISPNRAKRVTMVTTPTEIGSLVTFLLMVDVMRKTLAELSLPSRYLPGLHAHS